MTEAVDYQSQCHAAPELCFRGKYLTKDKSHLQAARKILLKTSRLSGKDGRIKLLKTEHLKALLALASSQITKSFKNAFWKVISRKDCLLQMRLLFALMRKRITRMTIRYGIIPQYSNAQGTVISMLLQRFKCF